MAHFTGDRMFVSELKQVVSAAKTDAHLGWVIASGADTENAYASHILKEVGEWKIWTDPDPTLKIKFCKTSTHNSRRPWKHSSKIFFTNRLKRRLEWRRFDITPQRATPRSNGFFATVLNSQKMRSSLLPSKMVFWMSRRSCSPARQNATAYWRTVRK